jgi:hypothetical protein
MVTRSTKGSASTTTSGPVTLGHILLFLIGACGIVFNVSISVKDTTQEIHQGSGSLHQNALPAAVPTKELFHLKVPFYVYEDRDLNWADATLNGEPYEPASPSAGGCGTFSSPFRFFVCLNTIRWLI